MKCSGGKKKWYKFCVEMPRRHKAGSVDLCKQPDSVVLSNGKTSKPVARNDTCLCGKKKRSYLQDAGVHIVHETSCPEWSHGKKVSQHSGCSLHCPMLTVDWTGVGKKMHWAPWKTLQDHLFKLSLTQVGWSSVYWMQLSFWRIGNYGEAYQHHRCRSASRPAQPPPPFFFLFWPAQLLVHWHGI